MAPGPSGRSQITTTDRVKLRSRISRRDAVMMIFLVSPVIHFLDNYQANFGRAGLRSVGGLRRVHRLNPKAAVQRQQGNVKFT